MASKKTKPKPGQTHTIRIIGGQWRGRKLPVGDENGLRPTGDRVRETLFNWLAPFLCGAKCLDAFAGTGALGLEALSRGAASVDFVESNARTAQQLRTNIAHIAASEGPLEAHVIHSNITQWQSIGERVQAYDIIFLDPPFAEDLWQQALTHLQTAVRLAPDALVYIESPNDKAINVPKHWQLRREKRFGTTRATLYETSTAHTG